MVFSYLIDTPKNTSKSSPLITRLKLTKGVIHRWIVLFPAGLWGTVFLRIVKGADSILPTNLDGWISGDEFSFNGDDFIYISSRPYILDVYTYNTDTKNDHKVYLNIFIKPLWTYAPYSEQLMVLIEEDEIAKVVF